MLPLQHHLIEGGPHAGELSVAIISTLSWRCMATLSETVVAGTVRHRPIRQTQGLGRCASAARRQFDRPLLRLVRQNRRSDDRHGHAICAVSLPPRPSVLCHNRIRELGRADASCNARRDPRARCTAREREPGRSGASCPSSLARTTGHARRHAGRDVCPAGTIE